MLSFRRNQTTNSEVQLHFIKDVTRSVAGRKVAEVSDREEVHIGLEAFRSADELLERLRSGDLDVLVATSVGEEGLDVPSVDLVVFYEPVPSGVRYIQRKGRTGRKSKGEAIILAAEETHDRITSGSARARGGG